MTFCPLQFQDDYVLYQINKFKKQRGFARDNSHQVEDITASENLEIPLLISEETHALLRQRLLLRHHIWISMILIGLKL